MNCDEQTTTSNIKAKRIYHILLGIIVLSALGVRLVQLDARPMHTDEAVHGMFFVELLEDGVYHFNPTEYHGPTLYYFTLPLAWIMGQRNAADVSEHSLRLLPVLAGVSMLLLLALWRPLLGPQTVCWAALFTAISPIHLYFSRYFIHETLLVLFFFAFLTCAMRYWLSTRMRWALAAGACVGLAHATKITSILMFASISAAWLLVTFYTQLQEKRTLVGLYKAMPWKALLYAGLVASGVSLLFYSSFFTNLRGVWESITTYSYFADRATGQGHEKPWFTHLQWLLWTRSGGFVWTEAFLVGLACIGAGFALRKRSGFATITILLAVYVLILVGIYSIIPYKTPWLMLGPMQIIALLAGIGACSLLSLPRTIGYKLLFAGVMMLGASQLAAQAQRAAFRFAADERVPYCYSHTTQDMVFTANRIHKALELVPEQETAWVLVAAEEYWPLPWYLRTVKNVGFWHTLPEKHDAPILVLDMNQSESQEEALSQTHTVSLAGLRPGVLLMLWIRNDIWTQLIRE